MELQEQEDLQFASSTLRLAMLIVSDIENSDEIYEDPIVKEIIEGTNQSYRSNHPVALFAAIQLIDELAQIIKPKRVAEMEAEEAWPWEMRRVLEMTIDQLYRDVQNPRPIIRDMARRVVTIIENERRIYEHS